MTSASQAQKPELEVVPVYFGLLWLWSIFFSRVHLWWNEATTFTDGQCHYLVLVDASCGQVPLWFMGRPSLVDCAIFLV